MDAQRIHRALTDLLEAAERLPREHPALVPEQASAPTGKAAPGPLASTGLHPSTRQAIQVTVASVIAMAVGYAVSAERWYWAVITAFVIFTRTRSRGTRCGAPGRGCWGRCSACSPDCSSPRPSVAMPASSW
ncbi:hypothetical protein ACN28S_05675 [Cystobacter fuscus]